jgi:ankyrin repeat protein
MTPFGTWLHIAAAYGRLEIIEYLINAGIDINAQGGTFSANALERAAIKGHLDIAEYLINQKLRLILVNQIEILCLLQYMAVILR